MTMMIQSAAFGLLLMGCQVSQPADVAIRGATIVDVAGGSLVPDRTVLIAGNRIAAVGPAGEIEIASEAELIEAEGGYLIPGLWDMHVHSVRDVSRDWDTDTPPNEVWHFPLFLAYGVTGVRNMNDATADVALALTNDVKRRLAEGKLLGPRLLASGPLIDGDPPVGKNPVVVRTAEEAAAGQRTVEHPESIAVGCSTAAEAVRERFDRVLSNYDNLPENQQFTVQFRLYRAFYETRDEAACASAIEAFRRGGVAVTPDLVAYHHVVHADEVLADADSMSLVPPVIRREWEEWAAGEGTREFQSILRPIIPLELENVRLLNEGGVTLLAATDVGVPLQIPGLGLHRDLVRLTGAGLTPLEALRTATLNPARVLGLLGSLGTIEAGKLADLVLLDADPLADIRNTQRIRAVVADGRLFRREDIDQLLAKVQAVGQDVSAGASASPGRLRACRSGASRSARLARRPARAVGDWLRGHGRFSFGVSMFS
jgi:imidazolonepropionase-like amidohydrolase